jgi:YD repeat-containing protein
MRQTLSCKFLLMFPAVWVANLQAAQFLMVTRSSSGAWSIEGVESVQINGKDKARHSDIAATRQPAWDVKAIAHLPQAPLQTWPVICRAPDGALWAKSAAAGWVLLLPDGLKRKTPGPAEALWKDATITIKKERADKSTSVVRVDDLYAILPGADVAASAVQLVSNAALHQAPGVDEAQAFRRTIELTAPSVKAFPPGEKIRERVRSELSLRLQTWSRGDAVFGVLEEALLLAGASEAAFPGDPAQKKLREEAYGARQRLDRRIAILRALDAGRQSDAFLMAYHEFEPFDRSFPDLAQARRKHLEASALAHVDESQRFRKAGDYVGAIRHLRVAHLRNPGLAEATKLLEEVRLEVARLSSEQFAAARSGLDTRSPAQVQAQRRLRLAEQYINDSKAAEAEKALEEAESIDRDEPRIKLLQASLSVLRGDLGLALALLDVYAGMAITPQDFEQGEKLRASVQYKIENLRTQTRGQLKTAFEGQRFAMALQNAADGLKVDNEEASFLYQAGVNACVLRHCSEAAPLLRQFLTLADSVTASREQRVSAVRLLQRASQEPRQAARENARVSDQSWFSGAALEPGIFYDPISLAFQPKVARISASHHLNVTYEWSDNQLRSIHTKYEEKKTAGNVARLALGVGMAAGAGMGTVAWKTPDRETNDFYFNYYDDLPQVFNVNRESQVVRSRTISVRIPGVGLGGFGAFGGLASLGSLGGMAGMKGLSGMGNWAGLFATASSVSNRSGLASMTGMFGAGMGAGPASDLAPRNYSIHGDPAGGSSSGYLTLWNNPRLDTELTYMATSKRVAVGFSGNHFFHPFVFDGIHLFDLDYDEQGRIAHAWELEQPNPPRLDFTWDGKRLMSVVARENTPAGNTVYSRSMNYAGDRLLGETITVNGKTSRIQYKYDKQGNLTEAECDDDITLDGRSRKVEFLSQTEKGKL